MAYKPKPITVADGGTGLATLTAHSVQVGNGTSNVTQLTVGTNGQVLVGSTTADPAFATLASSTGSISYTTGAGTLSIDVSNYAVSTFSPTLIGQTTAGTTSYNSQNGYYTRFLNMCLIYGFIDIASASGTGNVLIGNFPFTINANADVVGSISFSGAWAWPALRTTEVFYGLANTITANVWTSGSSQSASAMQMTNAAAIVYFNLLYQV